MDTAAPTIATFERLEYRLPNSAGIELFCRLWKPTESSPRAAVFLAHGFGEHIGYYEDLATALVKESFCVFAHDHVGHGQSQGSRVHIDSVDDYVKDVVFHFDKVALLQDLPELKFIVGHSMGGTIAVKAAMCHPEMFRGVVLVAPAVIASPEVATPMRIFLVKIVSRFIPHFPVAPIEWSMVTRNAEMVEKYTHDSLCHQGKAKAKWALAMYNAMQEINNNLTNVEWPFLVLHGSEDKITNVSGSKLLFDLASSQDKQIKIYEQASHNLLQELDDVSSSVLEEITNWISQRLTARSDARSSVASEENVQTVKEPDASRSSDDIAILPVVTEPGSAVVEVAQEVVEAPTETAVPEQSKVEPQQQEERSDPEPPKADHSDSSKGDQHQEVSVEIRPEEKLKDPHTIEGPASEEQQAVPIEPPKEESTTESSSVGNREERPPVKEQQAVPIEPPKAESTTESSSVSNREEHPPVKEQQAVPIEPPKAESTTESSFVSNREEQHH